MTRGAGLFWPKDSRTLRQGVKVMEGAEVRGG